MPSGAQTDDEIAAFLRAHPDFLARRPELYAVLAPPVRIHGDAAADHMAAMLAAARAGTAQVVEAGRAAASMAGRVQQAVLALFAAASVAECVAAEFPCLLGIDAAALCAAAAETPLAAHALQGRDVLIRPAGAATAALHGAAARLAGTEALVRLPGTPAALALLARAPHALLPAHAAPLAFLGRAVAAALAR